jgi:hypothetical protein
MVARVAVAGLVRRLHYLLGADLWPSPNGKYRTHTKEFAVNGGAPQTLDFQLERWIDPAKYGWYSGDHHVHAAGCSHYMNPAEGVEPKDMIRQILGERLNVGSVLTWGPDYYYQKKFFCAKDDAQSKPGSHYAL